jgi:mannan endo-1,4-beta-mannosidase
MDTRPHSLPSYALLLILVWGLAIGSCRKQDTGKQASPAVAPSDAEATPETAALYGLIDALRSRGTLLGHQDDTAYGHGWYNLPNGSDVYSLTGQYPAVVGWELGDMERGADRNLDSVYFYNMKRLVRESHRRGAINTFSWHGGNIATGGTAWDCSQDTIVSSILTGGAHHDQFLGWLDRLADFFLDLRDDEGRPIPLIFRPYHELTGDWFWWGKRQSTPRQYRELWRMTVDYLRSVRGVHHLLYAFAPTATENEEQYLERYPGDSCVDLLGFDCYARSDTAEDGAAYSRASLDAYGRRLDHSLKIVNDLAKRHGKIPAITETGMERIGYPQFFTDLLSPIVHRYRPAYILFWRNAHNMENHYYIPLVGTAAANDFRTFVKDPETLMAEDIIPSKMTRAK